LGKVSGLECVRCGRSYGLDMGPAVFEGCPECAKAGQPANLSTVYDLSGLDAKRLARDISARPRTMWRYIEFLPAERLDEAVTMHEGCTPMVRLNGLEEELGLGRLYVKQEYRNPTGSFKDRLASSALTHAVRVGAKVITTSSTGNHGSSSVAYSSRAGLDCIVFTMESVPITMKVLMQVYGGKLVACEKGPDRWNLTSWGIHERGWYPTGNCVNPPIGSTPFGVDGYKTMGLEICEDLGWRVPDVVVQPTAFGDGIYGMWKGFSEARQVGLVDSTPRIYAAEMFGSLSKGLLDPEKRLAEVDTRPTAAFSIGTSIGTHQAMKAVLESGGGAIAIGDDDELLEVQRKLGKYGIFAEASSCVSVAAVMRLAAKGTIGKSDTVVAVLTSTGQRDPWTTQSRMPAVPVVGADPARLAEALKGTYGFTI